MFFNKNIHKGISLIPLLLFIGIFLFGGIVMDNFYFIPAPIAILCGIVVAFVLFYKNTIQQNVKTFITGCGDYNIILMCIIALLAGAFSVMTKEIGAVHTIVQITKTYLNEHFLYVGIFVLASFLSFASGTSVGAITALTPIIAGLVAIENISISLIGASLLGGAMFGDNLSFISDTTIAATQSQNCQMKDKFWVNIRIALPAAVVTSVILICVGFYQPSVDFASQENTIQWTQIIPYIVVVLLAIMGLNVLVTLFLGVMSAGILALSHGSELMDIVKNIYTGFESMHEIFLVFMLMGGLSAMIQKEGGIQFLVRTIERFMTTPAKAKMGIGLLVGIVDAAIANNTIAIIITSPVARQISNRFSLRSSHVASILDIFSCIVQGILPYGAQMLLLISMLGVEVDYLSLVMQTYYIWLLLLISVLFFTFYRPNHLSKNNEPV